MSACRHYSVLQRLCGPHALEWAAHPDSASEQTRAPGRSQTCWKENLKKHMHADNIEQSRRQGGQSDGQAVAGADRMGHRQPYFGRRRVVQGTNQSNDDFLGGKREALVSAMGALELNIEHAHAPLVFPKELCLGHRQLNRQGPQKKLWPKGLQKADADQCLPLVWE